jgi:hypothetical protein
LHALLTSKAKVYARPSIPHMYHIYFPNSIVKNNGTYHEFGEKNHISTIREKKEKSKYEEWKNKISKKGK